MKRAGKWLTLVGALLVVVSIGVGVWAAVAGFRNVSRIDSEQIHLSGPGNSVTHHFDAGQKIALYTYGAHGVYVGPTPRCDISGPAPLKPGSTTTSSITINQRSRISFANYVVEKSGDYRFTCDQAGVTIAPPLSATGILGSVGGILLAVFGGIFGLILAFVGFALWFASRQRGSTGPGTPEEGR